LWELGAGLAVAFHHQGLVAGKGREVLGRDGPGRTDGPDDTALGPAACSLKAWAEKSVPLGSKVSSAMISMPYFPARFFKWAKPSCPKASLAVMTATEVTPLA
jgi:hypothetical protein